MHLSSNINMLGALVYTAPLKSLAGRTETLYMHTAARDAAVEENHLTTQGWGM
jgi:hypothetical protein